MPKLKSNVEFETAFDTYTVGEEIGEGGSGKVFGGFSSDGTAVAVKVLTTDRATTDKRKRFKNEIDFLSKVRHPNIVGATDHGIASHKSIQGPFYVMPRFDGNMREHLESVSDPNIKLEIFCKVLDGVEAVHLQGAFHRDLKPENVLVS